MQPDYNRKTTLPDIPSIPRPMDTMTIQDFMSKIFHATKIKQQRADICHETDTVEVDVSDDGLYDNDEEFGQFKKHPKERRRKHTERMAIYTLLGFVLVMVVVLMSSNNRKPVDKNDGLKSFQQGASSSSNYTSTEQRKNVYCSGKLTYTVEEWLEEDISNTAELCDPDVRNDVILSVQY